MNAETVLRREGFSEGRSFVGNDGLTWWLPGLDPDAFDRYPAVREFARLAYEGLASGIDVDSPFPSPEAWDAIGSLTVEMLCANYLVTPHETVTIAGGVRAAFLGALASFAEHSATYAAFYQAEALGYDRADMLALQSLDSIGVVDRPLRGWHDHDGPLFVN